MHTNRPRIFTLRYTTQHFAHKQAITFCTQTGHHSGIISTLCTQTGHTRYNTQHFPALNILYTNRPSLRRYSGILLNNLLYLTFCTQTGHYHSLRYILNSNTFYYTQTGHLRYTTQNFAHKQAIIYTTAHKQAIPPVYSTFCTQNRPSSLRYILNILLNILHTNRPSLRYAHKQAILLNILHTNRPSSIQLHTNRQSLRYILLHTNNIGILHFAHKQAIRPSGILLNILHTFCTQTGHHSGIDYSTFCTQTTPV